jgi:hypothetical protein
MLQPDARCVRSKMGLFLRLWVTRHRYEQLRPYGSNTQECLRFHLRQLQALWARVLSCQRALGLEISAFTPREHFEAVFIVSGYVQREVDSPRNAAFQLTARWRDYVKELESLSHDVNPFEFGEICTRCGRIVDELNGCLEKEEDKIIPMHPTPNPAFDLARAALF